MVVEFGLPAAAILLGFWLGVTGESADANAIPSALAIIGAAFIGTGFGARALIIRIGVLTIYDPLRSTVICRFTNGGVEVEGPGDGRIFLVGHGLTKLRWAVSDVENWSRRKNNSVRRAIEDAYGTQSYTGTPGAGTIERRWTAWRIYYYLGLIVLSPAPFYLGAYLSNV